MCFCCTKKLKWKLYVCYGFHSLDPVCMCVSVRTAEHVCVCTSSMNWDLFEAWHWYCRCCKTVFVIKMRCACHVGIISWLDWKLWFPNFFSGRENAEAVVDIIVLSWNICKVISHRFFSFSFLSLFFFFVFETRKATKRQNRKRIKNEQKCFRLSMECITVFKLSLYLT